MSAPLATPTKATKANLTCRQSDAPKSCLRLTGLDRKRHARKLPSPKLTARGGYHVRPNLVTLGHSHRRIGASSRMG